MTQHQPSHRDRVRIAVLADVAPRTVDHAYDPTYGRQVESVRARITRAALELGLPPPPPQTAAEHRP